MKACPYCAEQIQDAAVVCRFCNRDLATGATPVQATSQPQPARPTGPTIVLTSEGNTCSQCGDFVRRDAPTCKHCGAVFNASAASSALPPPKKGVTPRGVIITAVLAVVLVVAWAYSSAGGGRQRLTEEQVYATINAGLGSGSAKKVRLEVSGPSTASLTYTNASGGIEQRDVSLPWNLAFDGRSRQVVSLSAQKKGMTGTIKCRITVNGAELQKAESTREYGIASCSGLVP